jgi:hypothetical protein
MLPQPIDFRTDNGTRVLSLTCGDLIFPDREPGFELIGFWIQAAEDLDSVAKSNFVVASGDECSLAALEQFGDELEQFRHRLSGEVTFSGLVGFSMSFRVANAPRGRVRVSLRLSFPHTNWERMAFDTTVPFSLSASFHTEQSFLATTVEQIHAVVRNLASEHA